MLLRQLNSDILSYIITHNLKAKDRLPSLTNLSEILQVSVGKLREQLEVARSLGLVTVRPKSGIQVNDYNFASTIEPGLLYALAKTEHYFKAYKSLRNTVVAGFWCEATALLTTQDIIKLQTLVSAAWNKLNSEPIDIPHLEHRAFHLAIFNRLDNPFVLGIEEAYWRAYEAVALNRYLDYQYLKEVWTYHERMVDFIETKQFEASKEAFIEHTCLLKHRVELTKTK